MTIYVHHIGSPRPDMPKKTEQLGMLTIQHMTRTEMETWYSDDPEADITKFKNKEKLIAEQNTKTIPPIWM